MVDGEDSPYFHGFVSDPQFTLDIVPVAVRVSDEDGVPAGVIYTKRDASDGGERS